MMPAETPSDTALAIVRGGALKRREIYHPYLSIRLMTLLRDWAPEVVESLNRYLYTLPN